MEEVKTKQQAYFKRTLSSPDSYYRFSGFFVTDCDFEIRSKWQMIFGSKPFKGTPYLRGHIFLLPTGATGVQLTLKHFSLLSRTTLSIVLFSGGILFLAYMMFHKTTNLLPFLAPALLMAALFFWGVHHTRQQLLSALSKELALWYIGKERVISSAK